MTATARAPAPGAHGGDGARLAHALGVPVSDILDLSASLNPVAPDPLPVIRRHLDSVGRYPDPARAADALAEAMGVDAELLVLANGGSEAIALVAAEFPRGRVDDPDFSLYARHLEVLDAEGPRWRSNPHSPSGRLADPDETAAVWDEAFWPLATGEWTRGDHTMGSIVVGSLTKLLSCPGLRIGYVICPDDALARRIRLRQPQWSLNGLASEALPDLLSSVDLPGWTRAIADLRKRLVQTLRRAGLEPEEGAANWVLVEATDLRDRLAAAGICVRDCTSFGMHGVVRIAVPDEVGLARLAAAL